MNTRRPPPRRADAPAPAPLDEGEIEHLQSLLDAVPRPLEAMDVSMLDGFLCGVLLQPRPVPPPQWLRFVTDTDGRPLPHGFDVPPLLGLVRRRHEELARAIAERDWFDPWVFELEDEAPASQAVYTWVAGFATAAEEFPGLMAFDDEALLEPLALLYQHLDADDLEDADDLLAEIETMEPPEDLSEAVETLVRATLLLADVSRPLEDDERRAPAKPAGAAAPAPRSSAPGRSAPGAKAAAGRSPAGKSAGPRPGAKSPAPNRNGPVPRTKPKGR